jgi:hypothetical protein
LSRIIVRRRGKEVMKCPHNPKSLPRLRSFV